MDHGSTVLTIAEEFTEAMDAVTDTRVQLQEISDLGRPRQTRSRPLRYPRHR